MSGSGESPLLEVVDLQTRLSTARGLLAVVDRVSFSVQRGRTLGLVGESGCGKSFLARTVMGLLPRDAVVSPDARVLFNGRNLLQLSPKERRRIMGREMALVFQDPLTTLNPVMPVGRQVAEAIRHHLGLGRAAALKKAVTLLDLVGIPMPRRRASQYPHQLSGGLRQRVGIAAALACDPQLLIADEPTTALDVTVQAEILDLLAWLQREKRMAMILITHDLGVAAGRTDEIAVMYAGRIVEQAPTADLFSRMCMPYTQALLAAVPRLSNRAHTRLQAIDGQPPDPGAVGAGCRFAPRCPRARSKCRQLEPALTPLPEAKHHYACWYPLNAHATGQE